MRVSEVQIMPVKANDGLVAFASVVLEDSLYIGSIAVHTKIGGGYRLTYPTKRSGIKDMNICHPINRSLGLAIEQAVLNKAEEILP